MELKNTFWIRHFLMCNHLANIIQRQQLHYSGYINFALLYKDTNYRAERLINYFNIADLFLCSLHESDYGIVFDELEEELDDLFEIQGEELKEYYYKYCVGKIDFLIDE